MSFNRADIIIATLYNCHRILTRSTCRRQLLSKKPWNSIPQPEGKARMTCLVSSADTAGLQSVGYHDIHEPHWSPYEPIWAPPPSGLWTYVTPDPNGLWIHLMHRWPSWHDRLSMRSNMAAAGIESVVHKLANTADWVCNTHWVILFPWGWPSLI